MATTVAVHRVHGLTFKCRHCGFELNADLNASRNITQLAMCELSRLKVNGPYAPLQSITTKTEAMGKSPFSKGGS